MDSCAPILPPPDACEFRFEGVCFDPFCRHQLVSASTNSADTFCRIEVVLIVVICLSCVCLSCVWCCCPCCCKRRVKQSACAALCCKRTFANSNYKAAYDDPIPYATPLGVFVGVSDFVKRFGSHHGLEAQHGTQIQPCSLPRRRQADWAFS